jgi:hypothetical protein
MPLRRHGSTHPEPGRRLQTKEGLLGEHGGNGKLGQTTADSNGKLAVRVCCACRQTTCRPRGRPRKIDDVTHEDSCGQETKSRRFATATKPNANQTKTHLEFQDVSQRSQLRGESTASKTLS